MQAFKTLLLIAAILDVSNAVIFQEPTYAEILVTELVEKLEEAVRNKDVEKIRTFFIHNFEARGCSGGVLDAEKTVKLLSTLEQSFYITTKAEQFKNEKHYVIKFIADVTSFGQFDVEIGIYKGMWKLMDVWAKKCK